MLKPTDLPARIAAKIRIDSDTGCWIWTGLTNQHGYGSVGWQGKTKAAHRLAYELLVGPIGAGLVLDHVCQVKLCCNPAHLEPVTQAENMRRSGLAHRKEVCQKGHPLTPDNVYKGNECRRCSIANHREYRQRNLAAIRQYDRERGRNHGPNRRPGPGQLPLP